VNLAEGERRIRVAKAYVSAYPEPIHFDTGASLSVGRDDADYPGWYWCRSEIGREGWVHRSFLAACAGQTRSVRAYSAKELTVLGGELGEAMESLDGWVYVRLDSGDEGWLPGDHLREVER
jgi:hypothetical protein